MHSENIYLALKALKLLEKTGIFGDAKFDSSIFEERLLTRLRTRGGLDTIQWLKNLRISIYTFLAGNVVRHPFLATTHDGIPQAFGPQVDLIRRQDKNGIRYVLTLQQVSRMIEVWKPADISSITDPGSVNTETLDRFYDDTEQALRMQKIKVGGQPPIWDSPHFTTKSAPSGMSMQSLKDDLNYLSEELLKHFETQGGKSIVNYINHLRNNPGLISVSEVPRSSRKGRLRALGTVRDTEAKTRVIAMGDYWSQTVLKPLHKHILDILGGLQSDQTFGQSIGPFGRPGSTYYSFDQTSATDRIPVQLYQILLRHMFNPNYSKSWRYIMTGIDYHWKDQTVKYSVGQPMGLYSSWALQALVHHVIVQMAAMRVGYETFSNYRILGDDIVIRDDQVAKHYLLLMQSFGVEISKEKTQVSKTTFEFAKRLFHNDTEVTGFPQDALRSSMKTHWMDLAGSLRTAASRGFDYEVLVTRSEFLVSLYELTGKNRRFASRLARKVITQVALEEGFRGIAGSRLAKLWNLPVSCVTSQESFIKEIFREIVKQTVNEVRKTETETVNIYNSTCAKAGLGDLRVLSGTDSTIGVPYTGIAPEPILILVRDQVRILGERLRSAMHNIPQSAEGMYYESLRPLDLRIFDPKIIDRRRESERRSELSSSMTIRSLSELVAHQRSLNLSTPDQDQPC